MDGLDENAEQSEINGFGSERADEDVGEDQYFNASIGSGRDTTSERSDGTYPGSAAAAAAAGDESDRDDPSKNYEESSSGSDIEYQDINEGHYAPSAG